MLRPRSAAVPGVQRLALLVDEGLLIPVVEWAVALCNHRAAEQRRHSGDEAPADPCIFVPLVGAVHAAPALDMPPLHPSLRLLVKEHDWLQPEKLPAKSQLQEPEPEPEAPTPTVSALASLALLQ